MLLAHRLVLRIPLLTLVNEAIQYDVYQPEKGDEGKRLFYRPFVRLLKERFNIEASVLENVAIADVTTMLRSGCFFMASVHPCIRSPGMAPPSKGGHLVLVFAVDGEGDDWIFHNPSGFTEKSQENVRLPVDVFDRFYARRGILIRPAVHLTMRSFGNGAPGLCGRVTVNLPATVRASKMSSRGLY